MNISSKWEANFRSPGLFSLRTQVPLVWWGCGVSWIRPLRKGWEVAPVHLYLPSFLCWTNRASRTEWRQRGMVSPGAFGEQCPRAMCGVQRRQRLGDCSDTSRQDLTVSFRPRILKSMQVYLQNRSGGEGIHRCPWIEEG